MLQINCTFLCVKWLKICADKLTKLTPLGKIETTQNMGFESWISVGKLSYKKPARSHWNVMAFTDVKEPIAVSQT